MKHKLIAGCLLVLFLMPPLAATALETEEPVGSITALKGKVQVKKMDGQVWGDAEQGMEIFYGDAVRTGDDSEGVITLVDESFVKVHANSQIIMNTIISPLEKKNSVLLFFGRVWNKISKKALRRKLFEVQTPTAVCGVRGTDFETGAYEDGTTLVLVNSGQVSIDSEAERTLVRENQGTRLSYEDREIRVESGFKPDWETSSREGRKNLFADGEKYGTYVHSEIFRQRDYLKSLVARVALLSEEKQRKKAAAEEARDTGDESANAALETELSQINRELGELNKQIAYTGGRLECQFGLFARYGFLAKDPELSRYFNGKEFILNQLDQIEMIQAEFDAMIEEGMKMSMEDMEDLMDEMRQKVRDRKTSNKTDLFDQL